MIEVGGGGGGGQLSCQLLCVEKTIPCECKSHLSWLCLECANFSVVSVFLLTSL